MDGIRVLAIWRSEVVWAQCVKSAECQGMTVNYQQGRLGIHRPSLSECMCEESHERRSEDQRSRCKVAR